MRLRCYYLVPESLERSVRSFLVGLIDSCGATNKAAPFQSTVLKQMKLIHHEGWNDQERESYKEIIYSNTIQSMRAILEAMPVLDISLNPGNDARRSVIMSLPGQIEGDTLPRDVTDAVRGLWNDEGVREAVRRT